LFTAGPVRARRAELVSASKKGLWFRALMFLYHFTQTEQSQPGSMSQSDVIFALAE